jgi:NADPH:quinone reductase-like Zn-dependent oxidoreductase
MQDAAMATMQAIRIHDFGGPEVLRRDEVPLPVPTDNEVLVRIHAASVNPIDYKIRSGARADRSKLPITLGRDLCGIVENCGARVRDVKPGDAVFAMLDWDRGSYAQFAILKAVERARAPQKADHVHAAAAPLAALTAWQGLFDHGKLQPGQRVLIHGGAGGVGHMAIQLAKAKGAWVATTVSKQDIDFARGLEADQVIDYQQQQFEDELRDIDVVYDLIGAETQTRSFKVLKEGGALISTVQKPDDALAKQKNLRTAIYMAVPNAGQLAEVARLVDDGRIRLIVAATFPLADAGKAQTALEKGHVRGKIVLEVIPCAV